MLKLLICDFGLKSTKGPCYWQGFFCFQPFQSPGCANRSLWQTGNSLVFRFGCSVGDAPLYQPFNKGRFLKPTLIMKTLASLIVFSFSFFAHTAFAGDLQNLKNCKTLGSAEPSPSGIQTNVYKNAAGRVTVVVLQPEKSIVSISVSDKEQNVIFKEKLELDSARQHFDMSRVEKGSYFFTLSANGECYVKTVEVN